MDFIFRDIDELKELMTEEQKIKAQKAYEEYFLHPYGNKDIVIPMVDEESDGEDYLRYVDLEDFD